MRSFITALTIAATLAVGTGVAVARPADEAPAPRAASQSAGVPAGPSAPSENGIGAVLVLLLGSGGVATLAGAAYAGAMIGRRMHPVNGSHA
jgi:hypothetical protein